MSLPFLPPSLRLSRRRKGRGAVSVLALTVALTVAGCTTAEETWDSMFGDDPAATAAPDGQSAAQPGAEPGTGPDAAKPAGPPPARGLIGPSDRPDYTGSRRRPPTTRSALADAPPDSIQMAADTVAPVSAAPSSSPPPSYTPVESAPLAASATRVAEAAPVPPPARVVEPEPAAPVRDAVAESLPEPVAAPEPPPYRAAAEPLPQPVAEPEPVRRSTAVAAVEPVSPPPAAPTPVPAPPGRAPAGEALYPEPARPEYLAAAPVEAVGVPPAEAPRAAAVPATPSPVAPWETPGYVPPSAAVAAATIPVSAGPVSAGPVSAVEMAPSMAAAGAPMPLTPDAMPAPVRQAAAPAVYAAAPTMVPGMDDGETIVVSGSGVSRGGAASASMAPSPYSPPGGGAYGGSGYASGGPAMTARGPVVSTDPSVIVNDDVLAVGTSAPYGAGLIDGAPVAVLQFSDGSAALDGRDRAILGQVAALYRQYGGAVQVVGHASLRTPDMSLSRHQEVNYEVSSRRAEAVASALSRLGVPRGAIHIAAAADTQPVYQEAMPSGEAGNRRAEIFLVR